MAPTEFLNVYRGPQSLQQYFDPDEQPMLPLVELPAKLNPFLNEGIHIFAKMMTALPAQNVKALPALNMLQNAPKAADKCVIEASSGSTVISLSMASRVMNQNDDVCAYVTNKTEVSRLQTLAFFGLKVHLYGGPSQPEISDPRGVISKLRQMAEDNVGYVWNPAQYENADNYKSHMRWTGPQLLKQLPEIGIFAAGMGSAGCITGTGLYLKQHKPNVAIVGVCNRVGDPVPGPRPAHLFESISFPWREVVDAVEEVDSIQSYRLSMTLSREGLICGPSSGMALQGLLNFVRKVKDEGLLAQYADSQGQVSCVFPCCDLPYQYMDNYFKKLDSSEFHPIINRHLLSIDKHPYNSAWELEYPGAIEILYPSFKCNGGKIMYHEAGHKCLVCEESKSGVRVIDIRSPKDFARGTLCGAVNLTFDSVTASSGSPFDDVAVLESQWTEMKSRLSQTLLHDLTGNTDPVVVVVCYNGESARMMTSILRAIQVEAYSIKGGIPTFAQPITV